MNSLDPRVNRLPKIGVPPTVEPKASLDQFGTFEVFVQAKEGKPFQHEGIVHAPNLEMAFVLAKEAFTRRFLCISLYVVDTRNVHVSPMTEGTQNAHDLVGSIPAPGGEKELYDVYYLLKRGKQHVHAASVTATSPEEAILTAIGTQPLNKPLYNVWAIRTSDIRFTSPEEQDLWVTLPEKKFRDASDYKGGDKLKEFLERKNVSS